jgi:peptide/nickel transport system permease protein
MIRFLIERLIHTAFVLVLVAIATRALLTAMPGNPVDALRKSSPRPLAAADLDRLKRYYGLSDPLPIQLGKWFRQLALGDLGYSLTYKVPVSWLLWPALGRTLLLTGAGFVFGAVASVFLGLRSATASGSMDDWLIRCLCYLGISIPPFWLCLVVIDWFAVRRRWLPPDAQIPPGVTGWTQWCRYLALPVLISAALLTAEWTRYVRSGLREVLGADFLRAALARGLSERRILWGHALPNALAPFLTVLGLSLPYLVGGEVVVEAVFGWPGLGQLEYNAIREGDHPVAMAALLLIAAITLLGSLAADIAQAALDPRVRHGLAESANRGTGLG